MIIKLDESNVEEIAKKASLVLKSGNLVIAPFDTVYGIIGNPFDALSIKKIYHAKNRPKHKTVGIAISGLDWIDTIGELSSESKSFLQSKVPGKYTFIVRARENTGLAPDCLRGENVGIRIPDKEIILAITREFGGTIAQTSANLSGHENCSSVSEVLEQIGQNLADDDLIIDGGVLPKSPPSEIWNLTGASPMKIER